MSSVAKIIQDYRGEVSKLTYALNRLSELDGARNPKACSSAVSDVFCALQEMRLGEMRILRKRYDTQAAKQRAKESA